MSYFPFDLCAFLFLLYSVYLLDRSQDLCQIKGTPVCTCVRHFAGSSLKVWVSGRLIGVWIGTYSHITALAKVEFPLSVSPSISATIICAHRSVAFCLFVLGTFNDFMRLQLLKCLSWLAAEQARWMREKCTIRSNPPSKWLSKSSSKGLRMVALATGKLCRVGPAMSILTQINWKEFGGVSIEVCAQEMIQPEIVMY